MGSVSKGHTGYNFQGKEFGFFSLSYGVPQKFLHVEWIIRQRILIS